MLLKLANCISLFDTYACLHHVQTPIRKGGDLLVTVTSDNKHTIHVWRWMIGPDKFVKASYIPGWCYGPEKKLMDLQAAGMHYVNNNSN